MLTVDLHLHSNFSDGILTIPQVVDLCGRAGFDAIAITDHLCATDSVLGISAAILGKTLNEKNWLEYVKIIKKEMNRAWREYRMIVIPGVEFTRNTFSHSRNAHVLAIDVEDFIRPNQDEISWLKEAREQGALTVAAHPMKVWDCASQTYYLLERAKFFSPLIDAWEVANGRTFWRDMLKTSFSLIASSDLHVPKKWSSWRTQIECEKDPAAIKNFFRTNAGRRFAFISGKRDEIDHVIHDQEGA